MWARDDVYQMNEISRVYQHDIYHGRKNKNYPTFADYHDLFSKQLCPTGICHGSDNGDILFEAENNEIIGDNWDMLINTPFGII